MFTNVGADHMGRYRDRLVPVGDEWLIAHRFVSTDWHAPDSSSGGGVGNRPRPFAFDPVSPRPPPARFVALASRQAVTAQVRYVFGFDHSGKGLAGLAGATRATRLRARDRAVLDFLQRVEDHAGL